MKRVTGSRFAATCLAAVLIVAGALGNPTIVSYFDSTALERYPVQSGDMYGVWFSVPEPTCSLVGVRYYFGFNSSMVTPLKGFVNLVPRYSQTGESLGGLGTLLDSFSFAPQPMGKVTAIDLKPRAVNSESAFFIGWQARATAETALADASGDSWIPRSYRGHLDSAGWDMSGLSGDLAVAAVFSCAPAPTETGNVSLELRWNTDSTDLDLYLVGKDDTIYWRKPKDSRGHRLLDVDDRDGFGAEIITYSVRTGPLGDSLADVGVFYYGPAGGAATGARVISKLGNSEVGRFGWCQLTPGKWWAVGKINLRTGRITQPGSAFHVVSKPKLAKKVQ